MNGGAINRLEARCVENRTEVTAVPVNCERQLRNVKENRKKTLLIIEVRRCTKFDRKRTIKIFKINGLYLK